MTELTEANLKEVKGGGLLLATTSKLSYYLLIGGVGSFVIGFPNGLQRPLTCSSSK